MSATILFIDSTDDALAALRKVAPDDLLLVRCASFSEAAKVLKGKKRIAAVVTDLEVNGKDAVPFLQKMQQHHPSVIRIVLTAKDDFQSALRAMNEGRVFRYLTKPCDAKEMMRSVRDALLRHRQEARDRKAARNSLLGSVKALVEILDLVNPEAIGYSRRIRGRVMDTAREMGVRPLWKLDLAVTLCNIGCVALPGDIVSKMNRGEELSPEEQQIFGMHPSIAANLLSNIEQMAPVARIIQQQLLPFHTGQSLEARIIKAAHDLDWREHRGEKVREALRAMREDPAYDREVVEAMLGLVGEKDVSDVLLVPLTDLSAGMVMADDLVNKDGTKLLLRGQKLSKVSLARLQAFGDALGVEGPVSVHAGG